MRLRNGVGSALLLFLLYLGIPGTAAAAGRTTQRPSIGLALAGGGAKGAAHIGVLEILEELEVPVDYIAGTSMGSIIGGLYASGVSTAELRELVATVDWDDLLRDKPPRQDLSFRRKEDDARYLLDLELGLKGRRLVAPSGLISGQKLLFLLRSLTLQVADVGDFDELPIPFRAVATDVNSGEMVVLDRGSIASAMRASMAIPSVFSAVELDGRTLVDGGLVNNVPVDVVRSMGADVVIAVDLGAPLSSREVGSFLEIYRQTMRMLTRRNMEVQLAEADLVLTPAVSVFGTLEFDAVEEILQAGVDEARARAAELERLSIATEEYEELAAAHRAPERPTPIVQSIRFEGNERVDDRVIANQIRARSGEALDLETLSADLGRLHGLGDFQSVDFSLEEVDEGTGVVIRTEEKSWGPRYVQGAFSVQTDLDGETELSALVNLTSTRLNARGAEWRNDLVFGGGTEILSELYQPLDFKGRWFVAPAFEYRRTRPSLYENGREVAELSVRRTTLALDLGRQFTKYGELRIGLERSLVDVNIDSGRPPFPIPSEEELDAIDLGGLVLELRSDRLDSPTIPRHGSRSRLRLYLSKEALGADVEYERLELAAARFWKAGRNTVFASAALGWGPDEGLPEYDKFTLGGFASLSGFAENELRGNFLTVARLGLLHNLFGNFYLGGWLEGGNVWQDRDEADFDNLIFTTTFLIGLDTRLGPVYLAAGQAEEGQNKVYVSVGRSL